MNPALNRIWQRIRRTVPPYALLALALLLVCAGIAPWLMALEEQADQLRAEIDLAHQSKRQDKTKVIRTVPLAEQVEEFVNALPPTNQTTDDMEQVFKIAKANQISLIKGDYKLTRSAGDPLTHYTATIPIHAPYLAIRNFSAELLDTLPHVALDELRMNRVNADDTALDSEIRLSFVYRR